MNGIGLIWMDMHFGYIQKVVYIQVYIQKKIKIAN